MNMLSEALVTCQCLEFTNKVSEKSRHPSSREAGCVERRSGLASLRSKLIRSFSKSPHSHHEFVKLL